MAMSDYSLSDLAAATGENGFGGNGAWWLIILFAMIWGWGGNGMGRGGEQPVTEAGLCNAMNFNGLENAVGRMSDQQAAIARQSDNAICNLGYEMQGGIGQLGKEVALAQNGTNMTIMQTGNDIQRQMADCCCTTQRGLDAINANIDAKFAALEKSQLEGRIAQLEQANNQLYLREQMCGVVRYPSGYTYSAGNSPFCGCGCGNGNI